MSGNYHYTGISKRAIRRNRYKGTPYTPPNNGKPSRTRSAGTRQSPK